MAAHPDVASLADYYATYAAELFAGYEPQYDRVCRHIAATPEVLALIGAHADDAHQPNVILAAVRYLLADQPEHELAAVYRGESNADPGPLFCDFVLAHRAEVDALMATRRTQTNEIGRSAALALGLAEIHRRSQLPLAWVDLGCSAGLNLLLDRCAIHYASVEATQTMGADNDALSITCNVLGAAPVVSQHAPPIEWRVGLDRAPLQPTNRADARWLQACVFPSMHERSARLDAALALAQRHPVELREGDAAEELAEVVQGAPAHAALAMTTSWVWYYLPEATRAGALDVLRSAGRPVWWFSVENAGVVEQADLGHPPPVDRPADGAALVLWTCDGNGAERFEFCGWAHHHGAWIDWRPSAAL